MGRPEPEQVGRRRLRPAGEASRRHRSGRSEDACVIFFALRRKPDLAGIYRYIAEQSGSHERAIGYIRRIRAACEKLQTFPEIGRQRDDLRLGARILGFERRVVIVYLVLPSGDVEIGRVFYGGRDYEALIMDENDL